MARLYHEPRYSPLDFLNLGMRLYSLKQQEDLLKGQQDIARQKTALETRRQEAEYGKDVVVPPESPYARSEMMMNLPGGGVGVEGYIPGYKEREVAARETTAVTGSRLAALKESEEKRKSQAYKAQWENNMTGKPQSDKLLMLATQVPAFAPSVNIILDKIEKGQLTSRWDVYRELKANEAVHLHNTRQRLTKEIEDATKKGEIDKVHQLGQIYNSVGPGMLEQFFGFPKEYMPPTQKMQIAASLAAGTSTEERLLTGQAAIGLRQEIRDVRRQVDELTRLKASGMIEPEQENILNMAKQELADLKEEERVLLKKPKQKRNIPKKRLTDEQRKMLPKGLNEEDALYNMTTYGKTLQEVINRYNEMMKNAS